VRSGVTPVDHGSDYKTLVLDETIYCREAVLRASNWFTDRCYLVVSYPEPGKIAVQPKSATWTIGSGVDNRRLRKRIIGRATSSRNKS
jgi:hypothetical protein